MVQTMLKRRGRAAVPPEEFLFPNDRGEKPSKSDMVASWRSLFDTEVAGHSARRSGAMAYVRKGMGIRDLAYLGRWKSSVVADVCGRGVGDDLCQQRPGASSGSRRPSSEDSQQHPGGGGSKGANRNRRCSSCRRTLGGQTESCHTVGEIRRKKSRQPAPLRHKRGLEPANVSWSTACGWTFARKSAGISFVTNPSLNVLKCKKCVARKDLRDKVKKGVIPAQMIAGDMDQLNELRDGCGTTRPHNRPLKKRRVEGGTCPRSGVS